MSKEVVYGWYILLTTILAIGVLFVIEPSSSLTGYVIYFDASLEKIWDFTEALNYTYNSSQISINGTAQLKLMTITNITFIEQINDSTLISATEYEDDDDVENRTNKVNSLGNGHVQLKDSELVLEVKLSHQLQNNDILSLYILSGTTSNGKIYICNSKSGCNASQHGNLTLPSSISGAWYNITLSEISSSNDMFFIDSPDKIKIDMVKAYKKTTKTETITTISYPSSASLQTADFQPADWKSWEAFSKIEESNGQQVQYEYSTNSGLSWSVVPSNGNLSLVSENTIRFRLNFSSNTTQTSLVDTIKITYNPQDPCTENWTAQYGSCLINDSMLKTYSDASACSTKTNLPADNGTYVACDYCIPQWNEINSSCRKDNLILATFRDANACYVETGLVSDNNSPASKNYSCSYCTLFNCSESIIEEPIVEVRQNKTIYTLDAVAKANTKLEIEATTSSSIEIIEYLRNIKNETPSSTPVNRYIDIESNMTNVTSIKIILYYNDSEITALDENTLKIYYYNETSNQWDALPSTVNKSENNVYVIVSHLSLYGLFGDVQSSSSGSSIGTSGVGGGGSRSDIVTITPNRLNSEETVLPIRSELEPIVQPNTPKSKASCDYIVEISLPNLIIFGENDVYEGEIVNKGNCEVPFLKVKLSSELGGKVNVSSFYSEHLTPGNKTNFFIIRTERSDVSFFGVTSHVVNNLKEEKVTGFIIVEGEDEQKMTFRRELPVEIVFKPTFSFKKEIILSILGMFIVVLMIVGVLAWKQKKKLLKFF